jgi:hypothetical protein
MSLVHHETEHGKINAFDFDGMLVVTHHDEKLEAELQVAEEEREAARIQHIAEFAILEALAADTDN